MNFRRLKQSGSHIVCSEDATTTFISAELLISTKVSITLVHIHFYLIYLQTIKIVVAAIFNCYVCSSSSFIFCYINLFSDLKLTIKNTGNRRVWSLLLIFTATEFIIICITMMQNVLMFSEHRILTYIRVLTLCSGS